MFLIFSYCGIYSQNHADTLYIEEVEIIGDKIIKPNKVIAICFETDSSVIRENADISLSELLSENTDIFIKSYGQGLSATASFRGTGASHTQILWNGISLNNPMLGQADLSLVPVFFVDKAVILKSGSSLLSVGGALGGGILLTSGIEAKKGFSTSLMQILGGNSTYKTFAKITGGNSVIAASLKFYHEQSENDFLYYNNAVGNPVYERQKNADYKKNALLNTVAVKLSENKKVKINTWMQYFDRNIPSVMSFEGGERLESQKGNDFKTIVEYFSDKKKLKTKISAGFINENMQYFSGDKTENEIFIRTDSESKINRFFSNLKYDYKVNDKYFFQTQLTNEYQKANYFDKKTEISYFAERNFTELLIYSDYKAEKNINSYALLRANLTDKKFLPLMYSGGIMIFSDKIPFTFKTGISRNYKNPSLNDLFWIPGGNPDLRPEKSFSGDFNLNYKISDKNNLKLESDINGYISHINDWIIWMPGDFQYWRAENIKKVFARGFEFSLSGKYNLKKLKTHFKINYSYTKTTNETDKGDIADASYGKQLIYIPLHKANALLNVRYKRNYIRFSHVYTGERFTSSSNEDIRHRLPAYNIEDLTVGKKINIKNIKADIQIKIKNLLNADYQEILWRAVPGRQFFISLKIEI